ncbi:MCE family protein [Tsukamurella paurometabola]|uniref:MCE family protein n=1 Tax=Tsukamurella paurometabola TaxID=2061 RepID=A0ABS5NFF1_TSUPA|nr:MlaD family protein [Tsukamurella paurometabola]MBS4102988.1 MCE family protein [Tsukamurella paurometabola]
MKVFSGSVLTTSMLERDPKKIGIVCSLVIGAVLVFAFSYNSISFLSGQRSYYAEFADASGLATDDPVNIAGVTVGKVRKIALDGTRVKVEFGVDGEGEKQLGSQTAATIKVRTLLGQRYIELTPHGDGKLDRGATIPMSRTSSGYDITNSLENVTKKVVDTDKGSLSASLDQISKVEEALPTDLRTTIDGVRRLSETIASRDEAFRNLFASSAGVSKILEERNQQLVGMFGQGRVLFKALNDRSASIHRVLVQSNEIAQALSSIGGEIRETLQPTLTELGKVIELLNNNYENLNRSITGLEQYVNQITESIGSGPYFQIILQNVLPANLAGQQPSSPGAPR